MTTNPEDNTSVVEDNSCPQANKEENNVKTAAELLGFHADGVPGQLYTMWWKQIHHGIQNLNCYGPKESGINRWENFCEWAATQPTMASARQLAYHDEAIQKRVRMLYDDMAKMTRNSQQAIVGCNPPGTCHLSRSP